MMQIVSQITLCLMLLITTAWCIAVYRKLATMKSDAGPIRDLIDNLNKATKRADQTILAMRLVIKDADTRLAALGALENQQRPTPSMTMVPDRDQRREQVLAEAVRHARRSQVAELDGMPNIASSFEREPPASIERGQRPTQANKHGRQTYENWLRAQGQPQPYTRRAQRIAASKPRGSEMMGNEEIDHLTRSIASLR